MTSILHVGCARNKVGADYLISQMKQMQMEYFVLGQHIDTVVGRVPSL